MQHLENVDWVLPAILGLFVVIGGVAAAMAKLPWMTKKESELRDKLWNEKMDNLQERVQETVELCNKNARQIGELTTSVRVLEARREGHR